MVFQDLFTDVLPVAPEIRSQGLRVVRAQPGLLYRVLVRAEQGLTLNIHFHKRRTFPCVVAECPACKHSVPRRYVYLPVSTLSSGSDGLVFVLEIPFDSFERVRSAAYGVEEHNKRTLLGLELEVARERRTIRSPLTIQVGQRQILTKSFDLSLVLTALQRMWALPEVNVNEDIVTWFNRIRPMMM